MNRNEAGYIKMTLPNLDGILIGEFRAQKYKKYQPRFPHSLIGQKKELIAIFLYFIRKNGAITN